MTVFAESTCERKLVLGKRTVKPEGNLFLYRLYAWCWPVNRSELNHDFLGLYRPRLRKS